MAEKRMREGTMTFLPHLHGFYHSLLLKLPRKTVKVHPGSRHRAESKDRVLISKMHSPLSLLLWCIGSRAMMHIQNKNPKYGAKLLYLMNADARAYS